MTRFLGVLSVLVVVLLAMGFAAVNAGHRVTLDLWLITLYRVPVALVAFCGLFAGMVLMFVTGIHSDLKVRKILRERLADEARQEQTWIDRNQRDLFAEQDSPEAGEKALSPAKGKDPPTADTIQESPTEEAIQAPRTGEATRDPMNEVTPDVG